MNVNIDRTGSTQNNTKSLEVLKEISEEFMLSEVWRSKNPEKRYFSWYRSKPRLTASRLDFALVSVGITDACDNCGYINGLHSDHLAFFTYFNIIKNDKGSGYWKLNTSHLFNTQYITEINQLFDEIERSCDKKPKCEKWEYAKYRIREVSMDFSQRMASENNLIIAQLSEKICEMESDILHANLDLLERTKTDLEGFMQEKVKSCIFRSKATFTEFGERPTKYYMNLEKNRYNMRTCNALYNNAGSLVTDTKGILKLQEKFYGELYKENTEVCVTVILGICIVPTFFFIVPVSTTHWYGPRTTH